VVKKRKRKEKEKKKKSPSFVFSKFCHFCVSVNGSCDFDADDVPWME